MLSSNPLPALSMPSRRRIATEPHWRPVRLHTSATLRPDTRTWLTDNSSLTAQLVACGHGKFSVQRLYQGWETPLPSEQKLLQMDGRQLSLVREVLLLLDNNAVVFARSIFPVRSLVGELGHLRRLQSKSLGAILFKHPQMRRYAFELALVAKDSGYLPQGLQQSGPAWGRRCRFEIGSKKLLVSEIFLDTFTPWQAVLSLHRTQRGKVNAGFTALKQ